MDNRETINDLFDNYKILSNQNDDLTRLNEFQDIKFKTTLDKMKFIDRIQGKINKLSNSRVLLQFKYDNIKYYYDIYSIFIIIISAFLTVIEAVKNEVNYLEYGNGVKYFFKLTPIIVASVITLLGTFIKFKKYQENSENMSSVLEKSILTIYRLKKLQEKLHYADKEKLNLLRNMYLDEIFIFYNQSNAEIKKYMSYTEMRKYENKKLKCDFQNRKKTNKYTKLNNNLGNQNSNPDVLHPPTMPPTMPPPMNEYINHNIRDNLITVGPQMNVMDEEMTRNPMMNYTYNVRRNDLVNPNIEPRLPSPDIEYGNNRLRKTSSVESLLPRIPSPSTTIRSLENENENIDINTNDNENENTESVSKNQKLILTKKTKI